MREGVEGALIGHAESDVDVIQKFGWIGKRARVEGQWMDGMGIERGRGGRGDWGKNPIFSSFANVGGPLPLLQFKSLVVARGDKK